MVNFRCVRSAPSDLLCQEGPRGHDVDMPPLSIETLNGRVGLPESWLLFVARELREPDGFVVVNDGQRNSYAQAFNDEGTLLLEYRDRSPERHFQVRGVGIGEVAEALSQWSEGDRSFVHGHQWERLTEWDRPAGDGPRGD